MGMSDGKCIHFNGSQNERCKLGVAYDQFRPGLPCIQFTQMSARGGTYLRAGEVPAEIRPFPGAQPTERCRFYQEPTEEQVQAERIASDAALKKTLAALKLASEWRVKPKTKQDRFGVVECPVCKGHLRLSQSSYNGHVHGQCETEGCVSWME
jgi:hypothetical protein